MSKNNFWKIGSLIIVYEVIGFLLGFITKNNIQPWYNTLIKSTLTPPSFVFSIVWPVLYAILAYVGFYIWQINKVEPSPAHKSLGFLYCVQMLMNWSWTPLFFKYHLIGFSLLWIMSLTFINVWLGYRLINKNTFTGVLLIPYILWLFFATYLNAVIYWWN